MSAPKDMYLGDGCYVRDDGHHIVIYTHNGDFSTNAIYLEPAVFGALLAWRKARDTP